VASDVSETKWFNQTAVLRCGIATKGFVPKGTSRIEGEKTQFDKFAGENAVVKGKVSGATISVDSITASKS
jgi:hypothetical protein